MVLKAFLVLFKHISYVIILQFFPQRYGLKSYSSREIRTEIMDHYEHLMTERMKYTWISSANKAGAAEPLGMFGGYLATFFSILLLWFGNFFLFDGSQRKISKDRGGCHSSHFSKEALHERNYNSHYGNEVPAMFTS